MKQSWSACGSPHYWLIIVWALANVVWLVVRTV